jgi:polysaccharide biosynthesis protein PslH
MNRERPNILFVTHRLPYPPDKGDRIRTWNWLRFLSERANVYLATLADEAIPPAYLDLLQDCCEEVAVASITGLSRWANAAGSVLVGKSISEGMFCSRNLKDAIEQWGKKVRFDAAIASASSVAEYLQIPELKRAKKIVDLVDVDSQKWQDYADATPFPKSRIFAMEAKRVGKLESKIGTWADQVCIISANEARLLSNRIPSDKIHVVTNGVDLEFFTPSIDDTETNGCVFLGAMDYRPNVDAVCWFAKEVWPTVLEKHPDSRFRIVGRNPSPAVRALDLLNGIDVIGSVEDVRPSVHAARVVVAPLRIARGLQNKVLEAMAMGKPVVSSPQAISGFSSRDDLPTLIASDPKEWVEHLDLMLESEDAASELGEQGRRYAERYHDWNQCLESVGYWLKPLVPATVAAADSNLVSLPS